MMTADDRVAAALAAARVASRHVNVSRTPYEEQLIEDRAVLAAEIERARGIADEMVRLGFAVAWAMRILGENR